MKKFFALILALALAISLVACGSSSNGSGASDGADSSSAATEDSSAVTEEDGSSEESGLVSEGDPDAEDVLLTIEHDGDDTKITNTSYDEFFGCEAATAVEELLNAGKIYVNGIQVPSSEDETDDYQVDGVSSLYKTSSGWGYNVHKTTSADNLSFDDARMGFYETITTVRGHETVVYGDSSTGLINKIDSQSFEVFRITYFENHGGMVDKIKRGDFDLETERVRQDVETVTVSSSNFDENIQVGDIVVYWYGPDGWVMQRATPMEGTLSKNDDGEFVLNAGQSDEYVSIESNVSRYNLIDCNRPTQFCTAYTRLSMEDVAITMWCTPNGYPICFTYGDKATAKDALSTAIEHATAAIDGVVVSEDGTDVASGTMWVTQADWDTYEAAIADAQAVCNSNSTAVQEYDWAIYQLSLALGEAGESPSGFLGAQGEGTMA